METSWGWHTINISNTPHWFMNLLFVFLAPYFGNNFPFGYRVKPSRDTGWNRATIQNFPFDYRTKPPCDNRWNRAPTSAVVWKTSHKNSVHFPRITNSKQKHGYLGSSPKSKGTKFPLILVFHTHLSNPFACMKLNISSTADFSILLCYVFFMFFLHVFANIERRCSFNTPNSIQLKLDCWTTPWI